MARQQWFDGDEPFDMYADGWKYRKKPLKLDKEDFLQQVEKHQAQYGESEISWKKSTEDLVKIVIGEFKKFVSQGKFEDVTSQLPEDVKKCLIALLI